MIDYRSDIYIYRNKILYKNHLECDVKIEFYNGEELTEYLTIAAENINPRFSTIIISGDVFFEYLNFINEEDWGTVISLSPTMTNYNKINLKNNYQNTYVVLSNYDERISKFNIDTIDCLEKSSIEIIKFEDYFLKYFIDEKLMQKEFNNLINNIRKQYTNCLILNEIPKINYTLKENVVKRSFENEKMYHMSIDGKHRVLKYQLLRHSASNKLLIIFNSSSDPAVNADHKSRYEFMKSMKEEKINILNIRDLFGIATGMYVLEDGDTYPEKIVISLIEKIMSDLAISKENCILLGASKAGFASLYFSKKYDFPNYIAVAPIVDPKSEFLKREQSILGIQKDLFESIKKYEHYNNFINKYKDVIYKEDYSIGMKYIFYSSFDEFNGAYETDFYNEQTENVNLIKYEDYFLMEGNVHGNIASSFLTFVKKIIDSFIHNKTAPKFKNSPIYYKTYTYKHNHNSVILNYQIINKQSKKLLVIFSPYTEEFLSKKTEHKSGIKNYHFVDDLDINVLYIRDNFAHIGGFNILENGTNLPEQATISLIRTVLKEFQLSYSDLMIFGEKKAGFSSIYFGQKYNMNYISVEPLIDLEKHFNRKNLKSKETIFGNSNKLSYLQKEIINDYYFGQGAYFYSQFFTNLDYRNLEVENYCKKVPNVHVFLMEDFFKRDVCKKDILQLVEPYIHTYLEFFIKGINLDFYKFVRNKQLKF